MPSAAGQRWQQQQDSISAHTSAVTNQLPCRSQYPPASAGASPASASSPQFQNNNTAAQKAPTSAPTCICWRLPGLRQLGVPPAGAYAHVIHQYAPLLQLEPKLTLRGLGVGKEASSCCGERRDRTAIWVACLCVCNTVHPCCPCLSCTHTCPLLHLVCLLECGGKVAIRWRRRHDRHIGTVVPQVQEPLAADLLRTEALQTRGGPRWEGEGEEGRGEEGQC